MWNNRLSDFTVGGDSHESESRLALKTSFSQSFCCSYRDGRWLYRIRTAADNPEAFSSDLFCPFASGPLRNTSERV